jgi:long-chain acyl-CoA synthetase
MMKTKQTVRPSTICELLEQVTSEFGIRIALQIQRSYRIERWSYTYLWEFAERLAVYLKSKGLQQGDRVILLAPNMPEWVGFFFGCLRAGIILVPLDMLCTTDFVTKVNEKTRAKCLYISRTTREVPELDIPTHYLEDLPQMIIGMKTDPSIPYPKPNDIAEIMFTSGTTGEPKGVILTHFNITSNVLSATQLVPVRPYSRALSLLPLSHMLEQTAGLLGFLRFGATIVYPVSRQPMVVLRILYEERITNIVLVPQILRAFWNAIEREVKKQKKDRIWPSLLRFAAYLPFSLRKLLFWSLYQNLGGCLQFFICGGAYLDPDLARDWELIGIAVIQGYGTTESAPIVTVNPLHKRRLDSVGKVLPGQELIVSTDGEILIRGSNVTSGYWHDPEMTASAFDGDWYRTGDLGYVDNDGYLYLKGRKKDMISLPSGMNVYANDVEEALRAYPEVKEACVLGLPVNKDEIQVHAVLLLQNPEIDAREIVEQTNNCLTDYQRVQGVTVWPFLEFPLTHTLKIKKQEIWDYVVQSTSAIPPSIRASETKIPKVPAIYNLLIGLAKVSVKDIIPSMSLGKDLNLDSLARVELLATVESELGIYVDECYVSADTTVAELEALIASSGETSKERVRLGWRLKSPLSLGRTLTQSIVLFPLMSLIASLKIEGRENLKALPSPALFVANHASHLDTPVILASLPIWWRNRTAVAAAADFWFDMGRSREFLATFLFNAFPFSRTDSIRPSLEYCARLLDKDWSILIYPEGTRSTTGKMGPFKSGLGLMAVELGVPVVPVNISGTHQLLPKGRAIPKRGGVKVRIGKAFHFKAGIEYDDAIHTLEEAVNLLGVL